MAKIKCPYTYPHKSRADKVAYICSIGGYSDRYDRWPIEFNVSAANVNFDMEHLWEIGRRNFDYSAADPLLKECFARALTEYGDSLWEIAVEEAQRDLDPKETDTYYMLWYGTPLPNTKLALRGRGGKHLVIEEFLGIELSGYTDTELHKALMLQVDTRNGRETVDDTRLRRGWEWGISARTLDLLYRYVRQCEVDFTPTKACEEVECQAAYRLMVAAETKLDQVRASLADKEAMQGKAKLLYDALDMSDDELAAAWRDLCIAAGLSATDILY